MSSDDEEEYSQCSSGHHHSKPAEDELNNSLIQMGNSLAAASATQAVQGASGSPPTITLRLTRLRLDAKSLSKLQGKGVKTSGNVITEEDETDPRIAVSIENLLARGIEVTLGEHEFVIPAGLQDHSDRKRVCLIPSRNVNLDLSAVIALVSDITHASLPSSVDEAYSRFVPTPEERERSRRRHTQQKAILAQAKGRTRMSIDYITSAKGKSGKAADFGNDASNEKNDLEDGDNVHVRALASQLLREMGTGFLNEIARSMQYEKPPQHPSRFWITKEVRGRCLRIVGKIGGPREQRRAAALFYRSSDRWEAQQDSCLGYKFTSVEDAVEAYWLESRHSRAIIPIPLRIIDEDDLPSRGGNVKLHEGGVDSFWDALSSACTRLLASGCAPHPHDLVTRHMSELEEKTEDIGRASVTRTNPRLTMHTVETLWHGADPSRRWTTLTANRSSVREIIRECSRETASPEGAMPSCRPDEHPPGLQGRGEETGEQKVAAIWVLEPRSLTEGMRGDFVP